MGKNEIDKALGLGSGGIDDFLNSLTVDQASVDEKLGNIDKKIKENIQNIDDQIQEYNNNGIININIADINSSFDEIKQLIDVSKGTIKHVYETIVTSELVDSELIQAFSKLLESTHIQVSEYIQMYKDRLNFYDKVRLETLKHQQKIDLMERKHKFDMERIQEKEKGQSIDTPNMVMYSQEDITKMMD